MGWDDVRKVAYTKKAGHRKWLSCFTLRFYMLLAVALVGFAVGVYIALYTLSLRGLM
jgi:hypothetical protein